jgi:hypothetical protein
VLRVRFRAKNDFVTDPPIPSKNSTDATTVALSKNNAESVHRRRTPTAPGRGGGALWVLRLPRVSGPTVIRFLETAELRAAGVRPGTPRVSRRNMGKASH